MKAILLIIARLLFIVIYSISVGLLTGWIWTKIVQYTQDRSVKNSVGRRKTVAA